MVARSTLPQVKGNKYKTKRVLMEVVHREKAEKARAKAITDQARVAKARAEVKKQKRGDKKVRPPPCPQL